MSSVWQYQVYGDAPWTMTPKTCTTTTPVRTAEACRYNRVLGTDSCSDEARRYNRVPSTKWCTVPRAGTLESTWDRPDAYDSEEDAKLLEEEGGELPEDFHAPAYGATPGPPEHDRDEDTDDLDPKQ
eukprot:3938063-Rhodomonas_salina.1